MRESATADAPGRVNLIGEHTDYHGGYVLPAVIPQRTHVSVQRRPDRRVRAASATLSSGWLEYDLGDETPGRGWLDHVQGVTVMLACAGVKIPGFDVCIDSTIPVGAGLSSSAALEVSLVRALCALVDASIDTLTVAKLAHAAETDFVGAPVGIMDQMAASLGREGEALFVDTRSLAVEHVPLPASVEIAVIDSGIAHAHAAGEYVIRRRESFEAASLLGISQLRDVGPEALPRIEQLPPVLARRARHIITENERVLAAVAALKAGDAQRLGALFAASHASMRDDYEISTPQIDMLVRLADEHPAIYGARLTGGGFGGAVVLAARAGQGRSAATRVRHAYEQLTGRRGMVVVPRIDAGV